MTSNKQRRLDMTEFEITALELLRAILDEMEAARRERTRPLLHKGPPVDPSVYWDNTTAIHSSLRIFT